MADSAEDDALMAAFRAARDETPATEARVLHNAENDAGTALAYLVSMAQGHDYADERKISDAEDTLLLAVDDCDRLGAELRAALGDPDETFGAGTLHDNAPRDYSDEEAHIWTVGYRAALEYVATRVFPPAKGAGTGDTNA